MSTTFTTSRLLEFCTVAELTKLVGFDSTRWPLVVVKELIDNALDACEEAKTAPEITVAIANNTISIADNGPGIPADTIARLLDYRNKTSSREAYVGPTRGAQGNALQSLLAMAFALDGTSGKTTVRACGITHSIVFGIDPIRREPKIEHAQRAASVQFGTSFTLHWPDLAELAEVEAAIVSLVTRSSWLNPHASFTLKWNGKTRVAATATNPHWDKWRPNDPQVARWYNTESFSRLIAACVAHDQDHGRDRTVRDFIEQFRGLARTDVRARVLDGVDAARMTLRDFFAKPQLVSELLYLMIRNTKPVAAKDLGLLGKDHFIARFEALDVDPPTFQYKRALLDTADGPYAIETAFGYCPERASERVQILGVNWSPSLINPFRLLTAYAGLDSLLSEQRAGADEPIVLVLHIAAPRVAYTDKAKSALALAPSVADAVVDLVRAVTKHWAKVRKAEERDASREERRQELMARQRNESQKDVAFEIMERAYHEVSGPKKLWANARQIMYEARNEIQERSGDKTLATNYFTQTLLPDFLKANPRLTANWKVAFDDRGHFADPHTGLMIGLGTVAVREHIEEQHEIQIKATAVASAHVETCGPHGGYGAILYIEKEGFMALLDEERLAQRFDISIMSCKGNSVIAARELADEVCHRWRITLFLLHDFDKAGFSIRAGFMQRQSRRYSFKNQIKVIDLGLRMDDVRHLIRAGKDEAAAKERASADKRRANMLRNGATVEEAEYLLTRRVELNAFKSEEFIAFIERKLTEHGVKKIVPGKTILTNTYRTFAQGREAEKIIRRELKKLNGSVRITVPPNLMEQVQEYLIRNPTKRWDQAIAALVKNGGPR